MRAGEAHLLRPHHDGDLLSLGQLVGGAAGARKALARHIQLHLAIIEAAGGAHLRLQHIGRAEELRHGEGARLVIDALGRADLQDLAAMHDHDAVREGHGLALVVGHIDRGDSEALLQSAELVAGLQAQARVEIGQGLVEQQHARLEDQRAGDGHPLLLATGEGGRRPVRIGLHLHKAQGAGDAFLDFGGGTSADAQGIGDVVEDAHMRPDGVGLEHHAKPAPFGRHEEVPGGVAHHFAADADAPAAVLLQARDHPQGRRLAAARGAQQREEFPGLHAQVDGVHRRRCAELAAQALKKDVRHSKAS